MDLDLGCVRAFTALLDAGRFALAAKSLNLSVSAFSKRIQRLETELGVLLAERDSSGVVILTSAGHRFAPHARRLLTEVRLARLSALEIGAVPEIRIGVPGHVGDHPERWKLAAVGAELRKELPGAVLHCYGIPFELVTDALLTERVDVTWDTALVNHPALESLPLDSYERVGVVASTHPLADAIEMSVEDFADQPMIYDPLAQRQWMGIWYLNDVRSIKEANLVRMRADSAEDVMRLLPTSPGVTVAPALMVPRLGTELRAIKLLGVPRTTTFASRRIRSPGAFSVQLIRAMRTVAQVAGT